ncbi:MAG: HAMP domain-containing histidine kinase, partial [Bifidobacteriaceae bacterium]|nr:HAMP domain-containing histidine kinase [Bifidobacteriaceae bacterium]
MPGPAARPGQPLAVKLAGIIAGLVVLGLTLAGTVTTVALRVNLVAEIDRQLVRTLSSLTSRGQLDAAMSGPSDYVLMVFSDDASPLVRVTSDSHGSAGLPAIDRFSPDQTSDLAGEGFTVGSTEGDGKWRCVAALATLTLVGPGGRPGLVGGPGGLGGSDGWDGLGGSGGSGGSVGTAVSDAAPDGSAGGSVATPAADAQRSVVLALPLDSVGQTTEQVALVVIWLILAVTIVATAIGYAMVRRSLRPLVDVERAAAEIAGGNLATRIPPARAGTEVGHLTDSLNAMLTQIEAAFATRSASEAQMRTFVSDASHELRTPLAAIRGYAELYRIGGLSDASALAGAMRRIEDEASRMGAMVADLSTLARLAETPALRPVQVDLLVLAADAVADAKALDPSREVVLLGRAELVPAVMGDEASLRRVLTNLVANAVKHTPPGSPIELAVGSTDAGWAAVEVRDHGPGIPPDKRRQVFDRFFRLDRSRSRDQGGSGLGLAIVAGLVAAHGGQVEVDETPGGGAT